MSDPYKELATALKDQMLSVSKKSLQGIPCELGTITASGLKLDNFKHEIKDYLISDWHFQLEFPIASRTVRLVGIVNADGTETPITAYSRPVRLDFLSTSDPQATIKIHASLKDELKEGDRVLVLPVNNGQDYVVLSKVVNA